MIGVIACGGGGDAAPDFSTDFNTTESAGGPTRTLPPARPTPTPSLGADGLIVNKGGPELTGNQKWFNSAPTSIGELNAKGDVVLVDFWTYTCINCIRTLPFLTDWDAKYGDRGLTILGVHAPEFDFEKVPENVQAAIDRYGIEYPVVQDNDMATWDAFTNRFWPGKYLLDTNGKVIYSHFGEGEYDVTEQKIRDALEAAGHDVSDIPIGTKEAPMRDPFATGQTRELYGGYGRNFSYGGLYAGQPEYYDQPDADLFYLDNIPHRNGQWYVQGAWMNTREAIVHTRDTETPEDYLVFKYLARSVVMVINPRTDGAEFDVYIEVNDKPLRRADAGSDIQFDDDGKSFIHVDRPKEYRLVEAQQWGENEIKLLTDSSQFGMFAVTFGSNLDGA